MSRHTQRATHYQPSSIELLIFLYCMLISPITLHPFFQHPSLHFNNIASSPLFRALQKRTYSKQSSMRMLNIFSITTQFCLKSQQLLIYTIPVLLSFPYKKSPYAYLAIIQLYCQSTQLDSKDILTAHLDNGDCSWCRFRCDEIELTHHLFVSCSYFDSFQISACNTTVNTTCNLVSLKSSPTKEKPL